MKKFLIMFAFLFAFTLQFAFVGCNNTTTEPQPQGDGFVYEDEVKYNYVGYTCQQKGEGQYVYVFELRVENNTRQNVDLVKSDYQMFVQLYQVGLGYTQNKQTFHIFVGDVNQNEILVSSTLQSRNSATLFITSDTLKGSWQNDQGKDVSLSKIWVKRGNILLDEVYHN